MYTLRPIVGIICILVALGSLSWDPRIARRGADSGCGMVEGFYLGPRPSTYSVVFFTFDQRSNSENGR